jgi:hypothetical protein
LQPRNLSTQPIEHTQEEDERIGHKRKLIQAIEVLSNYLMFLLVVKPEMLPNPRPQEAHAGVAVCAVFWTTYGAAVIMVTISMLHLMNCIIA